MFSVPNLYKSLFGISLAIIILWIYFVPPYEYSLFSVRRLMSSISMIMVDSSMYPIPVKALIRFSLFKHSSLLVILSTRYLQHRMFLTHIEQIGQKKSRQMLKFGLKVTNFIVLESFKKARVPISLTLAKSNWVCSTQGS